MSEGLDPRMLLRGYAAGIFPMADSRDAGDIFWVEPRNRAIIPLDSFHLSRSLARRVRSGRFTVTRDRAFHRGAAGLRRSARKPGSIRSSSGRRSASTPSAMPIRSNAGTMDRAGRRALWREAGPGLLRRIDVQPDDRCFKGRAGLAGGAAAGRPFHPARLPVHDRRTSPRWGRRRSAATIMSDCLRAALSSAGVSAAAAERSSVGAGADSGGGSAASTALPPPEFEALDRLLEAGRRRRRRRARPASSSRSSWARRRKPGPRPR